MNGRQAKLRRLRHRFLEDQAAAEAATTTQHLVDQMVATSRALARSAHPAVTATIAEYTDRARLGAFVTCEHDPVGSHTMGWTAGRPGTLLCSLCWRELIASPRITGCDVCGQDRRIAPVVLSAPDHVRLLLMICAPCIASATGGDA